jgi:hypothetical protein
MLKASDGLLGLPYREHRTPQMFLAPLSRATVLQRTGNSSQR